MKTKQCKCGNPIPHFTANGLSIPPSKYALKKFCSASCAQMFRDQKNSVYDYPSRRCKICRETISKISKGGNQLTRSKYADRKTCDKEKCINLARDGHKQVHEVKITLSPMDIFLGAKP